MGKTDVKVKFNSNGAREILTGDGAVDGIRELVDGLADAANDMADTPRTPPLGGEVITEGFQASVVENPRERAHGRVYAQGVVARRHNAKHNTLLKVMGR